MGMASKLRSAARTLAYAYSLRGISVNHLDTLLFTAECMMKGAAGKRVCGFHAGEVKFSARPADCVAIDDVMRSAEYAFIRGLLEGRKAPVIFDLGANVGLFAVYAFSIFPGARILSVEAGTETFGMLRRNREANPLLDWKTLHAAVWKENGFVEFSPAEYSTGGSVAFGGSGAEKVPAATLDALYGEYAGGGAVDLLKIDIEGAEQAALSASESAIGNAGIVVVEVHPEQSDPARVAELLAGRFGDVFSATGRKSAKPVLVAGEGITEAFAGKFGMRIFRKG